jgi:hypothetical protein
MFADNDSEGFDFFEKCTFYFYYSNDNGENAGMGDYLFFDNNGGDLKNIYGCSMNTKHLFFWN